jgi:hypothetical protein
MPGSPVSEPSRLVAVPNDGFELSSVTPNIASNGEGWAVVGDIVIWVAVMA